MILVTGGTGLLGSHLLFELSNSGKKIRALYRDENKISSVKLLFDYYAKNHPHHFSAIEWVKGDILDLVSLEDAFQGVEYVYHCAALVSFREKDFKQLLSINRLGTANVVNMALKHSVKKFAYVSSTAAIGGDEKNIVTENTKWDNSNSVSGYALSKRNAEREVWRGHEEGLDVVIINPSVIFGAGNLDDSSLAIFKTVSKGLKFYSPGANAFVDARDVAKCLVLLMESSISGERFLCLSENITFKKLVDNICISMNKQTPNWCVPKWLAISFTYLIEKISSIINSNSSITVESIRAAYSTKKYSNEKIKKALDYEFITIDESIKNVIDFSDFGITRGSNEVKV